MAIIIEAPDEILRRCATAAISSPRPVPRSAEMHTASARDRFNRSASDASIMSHLLKTSIVATLAAPTSSRTRLTAST